MSYRVGVIGTGSGRDADISGRGHSWAYRQADAYAAMLDETDLDVVSVVTPITTHAEVVIDCARAGVEAVHCEKPMARTWAKAQWHRSAVSTTLG